MALTNGTNAKAPALSDPEKIPF